MKYIKKTFKILIVTLMLILMISSTCMAGHDDESTTQSPNDNYNGGQQDTDKTHGTSDQFTDDEQGLGFSTVATGYRFYIAEYEIDDYVSVCSLKKIITPNAVDIYMSKPDRDGYIIDRYNTLKEEFKKGITDGDFLSGASTSDKNNVARLGKRHNITSYVKDEFEITRGLEAPIRCEGNDFLPNGQKFRDWMLNPYDEGNNGTALIKQLWGDDMLTEFLENDNYRLIVEPIVWSSEFKFKTEFGGRWTTESKRIFLGTAQEWAYYMMKTGDPSGLGLSKDDSGKGKGCFINVIYSNALPRSMVLQRVNSIFPVPANKGSERLDALSITSCGYGEHVFRADDLAGDILATGTL